jgi:hypothetical protein
MSHFREVVTERAVETPRAMQAKETRMPPPPVSVRISEPQPHREESRAPKPALTAHTPEEHTVARNNTDSERPLPVQEAHPQSDPAPIGNTRPGIAQKPADTRGHISQQVTREKVQELPEPTRRTPQTPQAQTPLAPRFPALTAAERREAIEKPALPQPVPRVEPQVRNREAPAMSSPAVHPQFAVPQVEVVTRDVHVTIGKVTVQATLPSAPVHAPARAAANNGPRLTLERYLDRRGGRS